MELKLYNYLRKEGLTHPDVDFRETVYQEKLEQYDTSLGLNNTILNNVEKHLKTYNTYLKSNQQQEVSLRYYQILALYFTELYLQKKIYMTLNFLNKVWRIGWLQVVVKP